MLEQSKLSGAVELEVRGETIVISSARKPREDWEELFQQALAEGGETEEIFGEDIKNRFDEEEWEW